MPTRGELAQEFNKTGVNNPVNYNQKQNVNFDDKKEKEEFNNVAGAIAKGGSIRGANSSKTREMKPRLEPTLLEQQNHKLPNNNKPHLVENLEQQRPNSIVEFSEAGSGGSRVSMPKIAGKLGGVFAPTNLADGTIEGNTHKGAFKFYSPDGDIFTPNEASIVFSKNGKETYVDTDVNMKEWKEYLQDNPDKAQALSDIQNKEVTYGSWDIDKIENSSTPEELYKNLTNTFDNKQEGWKSQTSSETQKQSEEPHYSNEQITTMAQEIEKNNNTRRNTGEYNISLTTPSESEVKLDNNPKTDDKINQRQEIHTSIHHSSQNFDTKGFTPAKSNIKDISTNISHKIEAKSNSFTMGGSIIPKHIIKGRRDDI
jgi:hypothetical protein